MNLKLNTLSLPYTHATDTKPQSPTLTETVIVYSTSTCLSSDDFIMPEVRPRAWTSRSLVNYLNARVDDPLGSDMTPSFRQVLKHPGFLQGINAFDRMVALRYAYLGLSAWQRSYFQARAERGYRNPLQRWRYELQFAIKLGDLLFKPAPQMTDDEFKRLLKDIVKETQRLVWLTELQLLHLKIRADFEADHDTKLPPPRPSNALDLF